jgi:sulfur carrier protein
MTGTGSITVEYPLQHYCPGRIIMNITLNGATRELPDNLSASELLLNLGLAGKRLALEINQEIVPRSTFDSHIIQPGDRVEIVHAIGGG